MVQGKKAETLQETLDAITFKNEQEGKEKLKDRLGRNKNTKQSSFTRIKGLQGLQSL